MEWYRNLKIVFKLMIGFSLITVFVAGLGIVGISGLRDMKNANDQLEQQAVIPLASMMKISTAYQRLRVNLRDVIMARSIDEVKMFEKRSDDARLVIEQERSIYEKHIRDDTQRALYKAFVEDYKMFDQLMREITDLGKAGRTQEAVELKTKDSSYKVAVALEKDLDALAAYTEKISQDIGQQNQVIVKGATRLLIAALFITLFLIILDAYVIAMSIKKPIQQVLLFSNSLAEGNFTTRVALNFKDEFGNMAASLNRAADDLEKMISDIITGSQNLVQAIQEISAGNENLSQRTSEQASALEEVASTIEETTASIAQNAENSKTANDLASKTSRLAEEGGQIVYEAVDAINEINESSKKIEEITTVINDIAFQTNLLALNAAVEAARAGEQGRGFAVVTGEVRNLAQRSGNAAKEIGTLIKNAIERVDKGTSLSYKSGESLKEIIASIKDVVRLISEINASTAEQQMPHAAPRSARHA